MAITYGFFNSSNRDRTYDANDFNRMFDGIITDGVFEGVGNNFNASISGSMVVMIDPGRAFFNHVWIYNDSIYPVAIDTASNLNRIDAIVLNIDTNADVRRGSIQVVKGSEHNTPSKPTLTQADGLYQYAIAYVTVYSGDSSISEDNIEYVVGTDETPYVTAILEHFPVENLTAEFEDDFNTYFANWKLEREEEFDAWLATVVNKMSANEVAAIQASILTKENAPKVLTGILDVGQAEMSFTDDSITDDSIIETYTNPYGISLVTATQVNNKLTLVFSPVSYTVYVKVLVRNV